MEAAVAGTIAHLQETGRLQQAPPATTGTQPDPAAGVPDWSKLDTKTPEGAKAFDEYLKSNAGELIKID